MSYNRKVFYMSFYEDEEKRGSAGYVKVLERGEIVEAEIKISGLPTVLDGEKDLEILSGVQIISRKKLVLQNGEGGCRYGWEKSGELAQVSFLVKLSDGCFLNSSERARAISEKKEEPVIMPEEVAAKVLIPEAGMANVVDKKSQAEMSLQLIKSAEISQYAEIAAEQESKSGTEDIEVKETEGNMQEEKAAKDKVENRKWKQICKAYPHVKPFHDFREYIKLELKDMVLISEKRYSLVENSFLLHGYYNYDHIILWRKEKAPVKYYIGVPGNFYDKEKQVAVLYGFESFEGAVEPAKEGDFGYYMTEVSL